MLIRSYRRVFDLERRIYRIDRYRLNPGGIPLRGIVYALALLALALIAARLPLIGLVVRAMPVYVSDLALPVATAALLALLRIEGRPFHLAIRAMLRCALGPTRVVCLWHGSRISPRASVRIWRPQPILIIPDGCDARMRPLRYRGPGALLVAVPYERRVRRGPLVALGLRPHLRLRALPEATRPVRGEVIVLSRGSRLTVG